MNTPSTLREALSIANCTLLIVFASLAGTGIGWIAVFSFSQFMAGRTGWNPFHVGIVGTLAMMLIIWVLALLYALNRSRRHA